MGDFLVVQRTLELDIKEAYRRLKSNLVKKKSQIISESEPSGICVIQGSLWGTSPKTAQKRTSYSLMQDTKKTTITATSTLTRGYKNLTLLGYVFSTILLFVCIWMAISLQSYVMVGESGFWGWLAQSDGLFNLNKANIFIQLTWILSAFLIITMIVEIFILKKVHSKIDAFPQDILNKL